MRAGRASSVAEHPERHTARLTRTRSAAGVKPAVGSLAAPPRSRPAQPQPGWRRERSDSGCGDCSCGGGGGGGGLEGFEDAQVVTAGGGEHKNVPQPMETLRACMCTCVSAGTCGSGRAKTSSLRGRRVTRCDATCGSGTTRVGSGSGNLRA